MLEEFAKSGESNLLEQVADEEATRFAEIIDGPIRTEFEFKSTDSGLVSKGGSSLLDLWQNSYELTKNKAKFDVRQKDLVAIREAEYQEGLAVEELARSGKNGDGFLVISAYPEELELKYGKDFVNQEGFNSHRRLAFIRQYTKHNDSVILATASVDNSDLDLWSKITGETISDSKDLLGLRFHCGANDLDTLICEYDTLLSAKTNMRHRQGRTDYSNLETYVFVKNQKDLLDYNMSNLQSIALSNSNYSERLSQKVQLTKMVASALIYRYENKGAKTLSIESEVSLASERASAEGLEFISCGGYLSTSEESLLKTITRTNDGMKCVTCPFCKKTVDAIVKRSSIACPECRVEVNTSNNKVTRHNNPKNSFTKIVEKILEDLFRTAKN
jgi:hypothetical protein